MRDAYTPWIEEAKSKKKSKKNLPGNQEAIDADGDGKIEASDFKNLRKESMDLVRKEGSYHRIAYSLAEILGHELSEDYGKGYPKMGIKPGTSAAKKEAAKRKKKVDEAFADELEKEGKRTLDKSAPAPDQGGMLSNFRARRQAKGMEVAAAKGRSKGKDIEQRGEIKRARRGEKAQAAAAAGGPVTTGEKVVAGAGKAAGAIAGGAKAIAGAPGKAIGAAERTTAAIKDRRQQNRLQRAERGSARDRIAARAGAKGPQNAPKPEAGIPELPAGTQRTAPAGKGAHPEARAAQTSPVSQSGSNINPDLQRRFNKVKSKQGSSRQSIGTTRERMMKKGQLTRPGQGGQISASTAYTQLGYIIAEMIERKKKEGLKTKLKVATAGAGLVAATMLGGGDTKTKTDTSPTNKSSVETTEKATKKAEKPAVKSLGKGRVTKDDAL